MPPTRTFAPVKAVKSERTHEENQERAYIAASRRSDRSLEARVESARRASEIHKRRTGRALRVTEQDVINEEMYEEEENDLPLQYRRLTAHLQTGSVDFNRRLAAYLTNQVAMRSAMEQMVSNSYIQQYPNAPQFAQNQPNMYQSPLSQPNSHSPTSSYRQSPYPSPHNPGFRQSHGRAYSTAQISHDAQTTPAVPGSSLDHRRLSTPASLHQGSSPLVEVDGIKPDPEYQRQTQSAAIHYNGSFPPLWQDMGPFTTSLPPEAQQMLGPALDPNDPFSAMLLNGSEHSLSSPYYPWGNIQQSQKPGQVHPTYNGMSATLAPSALDATSESLSTTPVASATATKANSSAPSSGLDFSFGQHSKGTQEFHGSAMTREGSAPGLNSGQLTPGEAFWDSFVQDEGWSEDVS